MVVAWARPESTSPAKKKGCAFKRAGAGVACLETASGGERGLP
jgi:hypothetical protein